MRDLIKKILKEENDLEWAEDAIKHSYIEVGDVFYIVDNGNEVHDDNFRPINVRYVVLITDIERDQDVVDDEYNEMNDTVFLKKKLCKPHNFTYRKEDYTENSDRCDGYQSREGEYIGYNYAHDLVKRNYWRRVF
jgi:hypothetical protein